MSVNAARSPASLPGFLLVHDYATAHPNHCPTIDVVRPGNLIPGTGRHFAPSKTLSAAIHDGDQRPLDALHLRRRRQLRGHFKGVLRTRCADRPKK
jgi:hypothetical protein